MAAEKLSGAALVARVAALEGFVKVLIHEALRNNPGASATILAALAKASRDQAATWPENKELNVHNVIHTDDFLEAIRTEIEQGATK